MVLKQLDICKKKDLSHAIHNIMSNYMTRSTIKDKNIKIWKEARKNSHDFVIGRLHIREVKSS